MSEAEPIYLTPEEAVFAAKILAAITNESLKDDERRDQILENRIKLEKLHKLKLPFLYPPSGGIITRPEYIPDPENVVDLSPEMIGQMQMTHTFDGIESALRRNALSPAERNEHIRQMWLSMEKIIGYRERIKNDKGEYMYRNRYLQKNSSDSLRD